MQTLIWSMLMARDLDLNIAESILNAQENNPKEPENEKAMDLSNNRLGLLQYIKFKEKPTNEEIVSSFKKLLEEKTYYTKTKI